MLQSVKRTLVQEVEKLRSTSKELEVAREEKEGLRQQLSELSTELKLFKDHVQSLEKEKSTLGGQLSELREKGARSEFTFLFFCCTGLPLDGFDQHCQATVHFPVTSAID